MQRGRSPPKLAGDDDTGGPVTPTRVSSRNRNRSPVYQSATAKKLEEWVKKASFSPEHRNRSGSGSDSERAKESALRSFVALRSTGSFPGYSDDEEEDDEDEEHVHHDDDGDQHPHHHNDTKYSDGVLPLSGDGGDSTSHSQSESRRGSANQASGIEVQNQASVPERRASVDSTQLKAVGITVGSPVGEHIEVTFEGCAATRFLAFAPADETRTKGAALVGFVPNSDGSKSLLEQQGSICPGMEIVQMNSNIVSDLDFEDCLMLLKWGPQRGKPLTLKFSLRVDIVPWLSASGPMTDVTESSSGARGHRRILSSPQPRTTHATPIRKIGLPGNTAMGCPETPASASKSPKYISSAPQTPVMQSGMLSRFGHGVLSSSKYWGQAKAYVRGKQPQSHTRASSTRFATVPRRLSVSNALSNEKLREFLTSVSGNINVSGVATLPESSFEQIIWVDWVAPVIIKKVGAWHALMLTQRAVYVLEVGLHSIPKDYYPGREGMVTDMMPSEKIESIIVLARIEPSEMSPVLLPYISTVLEDGSEVACRSNDLFLQSKFNKMYIWMRMRSNYHRGELLDCMDAFYRTWADEDDCELPVEQSKEADVLEKITWEQLENFIA